MSASVLSRPCICWPTSVWRLATSCLLGASWACFWSCSICRWMSESCDCSPSMSWDETHPAAASAATRKPARGRARGVLMSTHVRAAGDHGVGTAVLRPAALHLLGADGALLAVGDRAHAGVGAAERLHVVLHRVGPALPQGQVVLAGAAGVGVPLDGDLELRLALQQIGVARQLFPGVVAQVALVIVEVDVRAEAAPLQLAVDDLHVLRREGVLRLVLDLGGGRLLDVLDDLRPLHRRRGHRGGLDVQIGGRRGGLLLRASIQEHQKGRHHRPYHPLSAHDLSSSKAWVILRYLRIAYLLPRIHPAGHFWGTLRDQSARSLLPSVVSGRTLPPSRSTT